MAQSGYTPISLYYSTTAAATPTAGNLVNGELAINITDGILYYKNSSGNVVPLSSSSGGVAWQTVQTTSFTAAAGKAYPINTTSAAVTVTLPASPTAGQIIGLLDYAGTFATNNVTINPNGNKLNGATGNVVLNQNNEGITFVYSGATQGWVSYSSYKAITPPAATYSASYLIVAGGAGGGSRVNRGGGGGGAGGLLASTASLTPGSVYTVTVGAGGASVNPGTTGNPGSNSSLTGQTAAIGGGYGGFSSGGSGGSGGGGSGNIDPGGTGTVGQGNNGGTGSSNAGPTFGGGGGGGSGAVGSDGTSGAGGNGGNGTASSITGSSVTYAGGGGGAGGYDPNRTGGGGPGGSGGSGGGGAGGNAGASAGSNGTANTGGGGGGADNSTTGSGGSGVVILSVPTAKYSGTTTGSPTITTSGGNTIIKFTSSGSYTA
jgi:hypothetical protein